MLCLFSDRKIDLSGVGFGADFLTDIHIFTPTPPTRILIIIEYSEVEPIPKTNPEEFYLKDICEARYCALDNALCLFENN